MVENIYKNNFNSENIALKFKGQNIIYGELDKKVHLYAQFKLPRKFEFINGLLKNATGKILKKLLK